MWENEIVVLVTSLKKRLLEGNEKVRFGKISSDDGIPGFVKSIFENQVQLFLKEESPLLIRATKHFNFEPKDIENLKTRLLKIFCEAASFQDEEVENVLRDALIIRLNYLVKPVDTMRRILFEKSDKIVLQDIEYQLAGFKTLLPYADRFLDECQKKQGVSSLTSADYGKVITDIVEQIMEKDPVKVVLHDYSVLKNFLSETKGEEINRIEGAVVQEFLADRNLWGFRRALDVEMKLGSEDFAATDLEVTLKRYVELKDEFSKSSSNKEKGTPTLIEEEPVQLFEQEQIMEKKEKETIEPEIKEQDLKEPEQEQSELKEPEQKPESIESEPEEVVKKEETEDVMEIPASDAESPIMDGELDIGGVFDEPEASNENIVVGEPAPAVEEKPKPARPMRIIRREQKEGDEAKDIDKTPGSIGEPDIDINKESSASLRKFIDEKTDKTFVKKLFNGDSESYEQLLTKLDDAESWRVAKILIDNELFKRDIDPFSREAIKLVDLVYGRYYPEEGVGGT